MGEDVIDRALYKKVKGMNRVEMEKTLKKIYSQGYEKALSDGAVTLDTNKLRSEIAQVKGIGEKRLDEIMAIIEQNLLSDK